MTTAFARAIEGIPVVGSTTERDLLFGVPQRDQRVQLRTTGAILRYTGTQWVTDFGTEFNVLTFLADPTGVVDSTTAIQNAITAAAASVVSDTGGATVRIPFGVYKLSGQLLVPASVRVVGDGQLSTMLMSSYAGFLFKVGTTGSGLASGCAVTDLAVVCSNPAGGAVWHIGTGGFELKNIYAECAPPGSSTGTAIFLDGGHASNIFSQYLNININHFKFGLHIGTSIDVFPTSLHAMNVSVFCDLIAGSRGIQVDASCGEHVFVGGNLEHCAIGIYQVGSQTKYFGVRFEANTLDVSFPTATSGAGTVFFGCTNLDTVSDSSGTGFNNHAFCECSTTTGAAFRTSPLWGPVTLNPFANSEIPLSIQAHPTQSADLQRILNAATAVILGVTAAGELYGSFTQRTVATTNITQAYASTMVVNASLGTTFTITPTDGVGFILSAPTNAHVGQFITLCIRNTFGVLGAITWSGAFKMAAWTQPANGFSRSITFQHDGTNWIERARTPVDVPN